MLSDEEEKDVDDWDVDMSEYYERGSGDKDAQDFVQMRRDMRREQGLDSDNEELSAARIGKFERHTKVGFMSGISYSCWYMNFPG